MKRTDVIKKLREMRIDEKKIGKLSWKFMSDDERMDALLSVIKDPDDAEQYIESEWDDLPPAVTQNMRLEGVTMGGTRVAEGGMKINKNARRKIRPHGNVSAGNVAIRFDDKPFTVVGVGTVAELEEFDLDGAVKELDLDPDDEAIAVEDPNTGYAVYSYDLGGAVVYEGIEIDENKLSEAYKIGDEVILRGNSTVTDILKVVSMRKKSGSKMAYKVEFPNGEVAEYDETELSLNPGLKEATFLDQKSPREIKRMHKTLKDAATLINSLKFYGTDEQQKQAKKIHGTGGMYKLMNLIDQALEAKNESVKKNDTISMDRLKEIIKEEMMNETRNLDKMQAKLRTVDNAQDVLRTLRDIISDTNTFNGQQFTKLEDIYEEIRELKNDAGMNIGDLVSPAILDAFRKDMAEVPTVLSMLRKLEGDRVSKYAEFGE
jgi:hypothetical protein